MIWYRRTAELFAATFRTVWEDLNRCVEARDRLRRVAAPNDPLPLAGRHRDYLEWLHRRIGYCAAVERIVGRRIFGELADIEFVPPSRVPRRER